MKWRGPRLKTSIVLLLGCLGLLAGCLDSSTRQVVGRLEVSPRTIEIPAVPPLPVQFKGQKLQVGFADPVQLDLATGLLTRDDGATFTLEIELVDRQENVHRLRAQSQGAKIGYGPETLASDSWFPQGREFKTVRIRGSRSVVLTDLTWYCWTGK